MSATPDPDPYEDDSCARCLHAEYDHRTEEPRSPCDLCGCEAYS